MASPEPLAFVTDGDPLEAILRASAAWHRHLCPRQVLGARMGLVGARILGLELPRADKRLLAIMETDGCAVDGVAEATNCRVGARTMRIEDVGKVAATFVDVVTENAVRVVPRPDIRASAESHAPWATSRWEAQLHGYRLMPDDELLAWRTVALATSIATIVSRPGRGVVCSGCGEEVINEREVKRNGAVVCRTCAGLSYYRALPRDGADHDDGGRPPDRRG